MVAATVERNPPGVPDAIGKNFRPALFPVSERIVARDSIRSSLVHIDPKNLSEQYRRVLSVALGRMALALVVGVATVADRDIEMTLGPEGNRPSVVVEIRLVDFQQ